MSSAVSAIDARVARMVGPFFSGGLGVWGWVWVWGREEGEEYRQRERGRLMGCRRSHPLGR